VVLLLGKTGNKQPNLMVQGASKILTLIFMFVAFNLMVSKEEIE